MINVASGHRAWRRTGSAPLNPRLNSSGDERGETGWGRNGLRGGRIEERWARKKKKEKIIITKTTTTITNITIHDNVERLV